MKLFLTLILIQSFTYSAKLGNRYFLSNKLEATFGQHSVEYIQSNILENGDTFSGPCDPYLTYRGKKGIHNKREDCFSGLHESKLQYWGKQSPVRISNLNRTCLLISKDKKIIKYIRANRKDKELGEFLIDELRPFLPNTIKNNILKKVQSFKSDEEVIYKICKSPFWQYI